MALGQYSGQQERKAGIEVARMVLDSRLFYLRLYSTFACLLVPQEELGCNHYDTYTDARSRYWLCSPSFTRTYRRQRSKFSSAGFLGCDPAVTTAIGARCVPYEWEIHGPLSTTPYSDSEAKVFPRAHTCKPGKARSTLQERNLSLLVRDTVQSTDTHTPSKPDYRY